MKCPHCGNKVDQVFLQQDNTFLMIQCTVCLFRCDGAYWEKLDLKDHVIRQAIELLDDGYDRRTVMKLLKTTLEDK
jgi:uncharacterized protein (UPF0212 family)